MLLARGATGHGALRPRARGRPAGPRPRPAAGDEPSGDAEPDDRGRPADRARAPAARAAPASPHVRGLPHARPALVRSAADGRRPARPRVRARRRDRGGEVVAAVGPAGALLVHGRARPRGPYAQAPPPGPHPSGGGGMPRDHRALRVRAPQLRPLARLRRAGDPPRRQPGPLRGRHRTQRRSRRSSAPPRCTSTASESRCSSRPISSSARQHPGARLLLSKPREARLAHAFADPDNGVELVDMDDAAVLAELNGRAWAAALPSTNEAFGLVLVEALATGTPVVASDLGPFPEIVDRPEIGRLFPGDDPADLAAALLETFELAGDPGRATRASPAPATSPASAPRPRTRSSTASCSPHRDRGRPPHLGMIWADEHARDSRSRRLPRPPSAAALVAERARGADASSASAGRSSSATTPRARRRTSCSQPIRWRCRATCAT